MKRMLRIVAVVVAILVVVIAIAPFVIPVNQFRPTIEEKASQAVGRKVEVGNLSLSILHGSLVADNLAIADDPKFNSSPFLTAKSVKVGVKLIPLILSKAIDVTDITIDNPQVTLMRNPGGQWNYSSLGTSAAKTEANQAPPVAQPGSDSSSPSREFSVDKLTLDNGRLIVGSTNSPKRSVYDNVTVVASNVSANSKSPVSVTADLPGGGKFKLDGTAGPLAADADLTPVNAALSITSLNLASTGFVDSSKGLGGILDLNATLASQNGQAQTKGTAKLSKALLVAGGEASPVPVTVDFDSKYDLAKNAGTLEPSVLKIGSAAAHLTGTYQVPDQATIVNIRVEGQDMPAKDLEAFLPAIGIHVPKGASLQAGTFNTKLDLAGPTTNLVTTGNVTLSAAKLANFDLGSKLRTISSLIGVNTGKDLEIEKMTTDLRVATDGIKADKFDAVVPSLGSLVGSGTIDSKNSLDFKMAATLKGGVGGVGGLASAPSGLAANAIGGLFGRAPGSSPSSSCKGAEAAIPFQVKGTTSDPQFVPDIGGIAASTLKSQLGCLGNLLPGAAQAGKQNSPGNSSNPLGALGNLFKKQ